MKRRVLAVDDNPFNLGIIEEILGDEFALSFATDGADAIRQAKHRRPMAILLDVMMPKLDGLETCRRLRAADGLHDVTIIMTTAKAMPSEREAGFGAGADHYITKPFDEVELLALLRECAANERQFRQQADDEREYMASER